MAIKHILEKNIKYHISVAKRARNTNEVSISNKFSMTNKLRWLFLSLEVILAPKFKMWDVWKLENS